MHVVSQMFECSIERHFVDLLNSLITVSGNNACVTGQSIGRMGGCWMVDTKASLDF